MMVESACGILEMAKEWSHTKYASLVLIQHGCSWSHCSRQTPVSMCNMRREEGHSRFTAAVISNESAPMIWKILLFTLKGTGRLCVAQISLPILMSWIPSLALLPALSKYSEQKATNYKCPTAFKPALSHTAPTPLLGECKEFDN